jgi:hypothetical protein
MAGRARELYLPDQQVKHLVGICKVLKVSFTFWHRQLYPTITGMLYMCGTPAKGRDQVPQVMLYMCGTPAKGRDQVPQVMLYMCGTPAKGRDQVPQVDLLHCWNKTSCLGLSFK